MVAQVVPPLHMVQCAHRGGHVDLLCPAVHPADVLEELLEHPGGGELLPAPGLHHLNGILDPGDGEASQGVRGCVHSLMSTDILRTWDPSLLIAPIVLKDLIRKLLLMFSLLLLAVIQE